MDYQKTIDSFFKIKSDYIIEKLNEYKAQSRPFEFAIDKVRLILSDERSNSLINSNRDLFNNCIYNFNHFESLYQKRASISLVIENEINLEFEKIKTQKIIDKNRNEVVNYSFEAFINDLIEYDSLGRIEARLSINSELYKIFYETNNYDDFTLESFDGHVINSLLFKKVYTKQFPGKSIPIAIEKKDRLGNTDYEIVKNEDDKKKNLIINSEVKNYEIINKLNQFEEDEKFLILHCLYKIIQEKKFDSKNIELSEFLRIIRICQNIDDTTVFNKNYTQKFYKRVSDGLDYSSKKSYRLNLKERTLNKVKDFQVKEVEEYLKCLKI